MPSHTVEILHDTLLAKPSFSGYMIEVDALIDSELKPIFVVGADFKVALDNLKHEIEVFEKYGMSMADAWADPRYHDELCGLIL